MLLVFERFAYPDYLPASADELIDGQYADRAALRPILDAVLLRAASIGEVSVQARKTYVTLVSRKRTFALIQPTSRSRVDVGLRLPGAQPCGRLLPGKGLGNDYVNVKISLTTLDDVDEELLDWLRRAYAANA